MTSSTAVMSKAPKIGPKTPFTGTIRDAKSAVMLSVRLNPETGLTWDVRARCRAPAKEAGKAAAIMPNTLTV